MMMALILKFLVSVFWIRFRICRFFFNIFRRCSFSYFKPKPNLRVNALNLKGIEWLLQLGEDYVKNLRKMYDFLKSCSLMEVDLDKGVEFKIDKIMVEDKSLNMKVKDPSWEEDRDEGKRVLSADGSNKNKKDDHGTIVNPGLIPGATKPDTDIDIGDPLHIHDKKKPGQ